VKVERKSFLVVFGEKKRWFIFEYQESFLGGKGGRCVGLTTLPPSFADCLKTWEPRPPGALRAFLGLYGTALPFYKCVLVLWVLLNLLLLETYHVGFAFGCLVSFRTFHMTGFIVSGIVSSLKLAIDRSITRYTSLSNPWDTGNSTVMLGLKNSSSWALVTEYSLSINTVTNKCILFIVEQQDHSFVKNVQNL
jgi:hypothetical protein